MAMHFGPLLQLHAIFLLVFLAFHASSCEQEDYWQMKLPKVPMPQAITDNLFHPKDQMSMMTPSIETKEKAAQGNDADKAKKANMNQPFTVMAWKYDANNEKEKVGIDQPYTVMAWKYNDNAKEKVGIDQPYTVMDGKYNVDSTKEKVGINQPYTVMGWKYNADRTKEKVNIDQPYTVMGWKYNADSAKEKVNIDQPYTVMGRKYNADSAKEKVNIDQPYTVMGWKYNADSAKEKVNIDQPYTVMGWKYNADSAKKKVGIDQPYTVMGWKYNADSAKEKVNIDQPYTVMGRKYNADSAKEKVNIDQPYTVMGWKYNADSAKEKVNIDQPYTVMGWKYNADSAKKKVGIDQPYTVMGWKYNADSAKEKVGIDQPYTVMGWKYNADSAKEKVGIDQPYTVMGWKYKAGDAKKRVGLDQPYTVMAWKYNEENGNKEKVNEVSSGSVFFVEKSLRLGEKLKHDFQKTPSVPFLPKHIAESIPFSGDKFTEILDLFSIKPGSVEATGIKGTLDICLHRPKVEKENRTCAQSMEDIVDFVVRELGSNDLELRMMRSDIEVPKGIQDYVLTKVKKLVVPGNTAAACHRMSYPYVVYYCHHQQDIGHYDVTLVSPTSGNTIQTTAVCHYDTYAWKPNVPALQYLGIRPGDAPVCHFSAINDMFWSLKANSKSLDMVV